MWPAQGVSAWNFDVAALKEQAAREGDQPHLPTISEAPPASAEGGPQSYPLKLHPSGHDIAPGNGERASPSAPQRLPRFRTAGAQVRPDSLTQSLCTHCNAEACSQQCQDVMHQMVKQSSVLS